MRHLFSPEGDQALEAAMRLRPLLAFDFDGTLAPIVARHEEARVPKAVSVWLEQLAARSPVAIVTGRSVADVAPRLGFEPRYIIGNHGCEDPAGDMRRPDTAALDTLRQRLAAQAAALSKAGVEIEDKRYSLALHYRLARNQALASARIDEVLRTLESGLKTFGGKCVVNIAPADAPDKGEAIISLVRQSGTASAVFIGDDINDESVFAGAPVEWLTVRIGRDFPGSAARFFLDSRSEVTPLLQKILALLRSP
ncbi:MAG: trehalose-phosphatase [Betaproteobacteria bacterium]